MEWSKKEITLKDFPNIIEQGRAMAKQGEELVTHLYCVYTKENDQIIYISPLLDFIDAPVTENIVSFFLYQMVN